MKPKLSKANRDLITFRRAKTRFDYLKRKFKEEFFSGETDITINQAHFTHYELMHKMFTDYAMKKLDETTFDDPNMTTEEKIHTIIIDALNASESQCHSEYSNFQSSEADKLKSKLSELPKNSLVVQKEKMRIDPNTPFNRYVNNSSIINQRNSFLHTYQGSSSSSSSSLKRRRIEFEKPQKNAKINSTEVDHSRDSYIIEALDECELSHIPLRNSKVIYGNENSTKFQQTNSIENNSTSAEEPEVPLVENSLVIPSFHVTSDYESDNSYSPDVVRNNNSTITYASKANVLRNIQNFTSSTSRDLIEKLQENSALTIKKIKKPEVIPVWFKDFLVKYDNDVKLINNKLDKLLGLSPAIPHPKITNLKLQHL